MVICFHAIQQFIVINEKLREKQIICLYHTYTLYIVTYIL